jgi:hypothetical protein
MSSNTKNIYDQHIKPLSREQQVQLMDLLRNEFENGGDDGQRGFGSKVGEADG